MTNKDLTHQVLETIKQKNLKPKPRWEFLLKNYSIWVIAGLFLFISSLAASVVIYMVKNNDWDLQSQLSGNLISFIVITLPYLWLVFLGLFVLVVHYNFKHTKTGYRYKFPVILVSIVAASLIFGFIFYNLGLAQVIDDSLTQKIPAYRNYVFCRRAKMWNQPERGFLFGIVHQVENQENFTVHDCQRKVWFITATSTLRHPTLQIRPRISVKLIGEKIGESEFCATYIRPFAPNPGPWPLFRHQIPPPPFSPHQ